MQTTLTTDVLIIGAGPTGLSLAGQLLRYGVDFIIVEKNEGITPYSKAIGVHARTLEIFDQIGLAQEAVARGTIAGRARLIIDGEIRGELLFSDVGKGMSPFPFVLMLEQSKPTVCLNVTALVASSCRYNRGVIEQRVAHECTVHAAAQRGLAERPQR